MADKKEIAKDIGLSLLPPPLGVGAVALKKALKKYRESKDKKEKARLQKLIDDLKSEIKLSKGDRGAAEAMPKKKAEQNIEFEALKKRYEKSMEEYEKPIRKIKEKHPLDKRKPFGGAKFKWMKMKKGGSVSKYSKGGGVRKSKYSL